MESESLPALGNAASYELNRSGIATPQGAFETVDDAVLQRVEQRLIKQLRGSGVIVMHGVAVPATATVIDHLCVCESAITVIDVERDPASRDQLVSRVSRETDSLASILADGGLATGEITGAVCRPDRGLVRRSHDGEVTIDGVKGVAKLASRSRAGRPIDVQLALILLRSELGREGQRSHRITRPDGF